MSNLALTIIAFAALAASYHEMLVAANENIPIFVRTKTGKTMLLEMPAGATVLMLKDQIELKEGFAQDQQLLVFKGTKLEDDDKLLEDYEIAGGSTINQFWPLTDNLIFIEDLLASKTMSFKFEQSLTVNEIRARFLSATAIWANYSYLAIRLFFNGQQLEDGRDLTDYNISASSTLTMTQRFDHVEPAR